MVTIYKTKKNTIRDKESFILSEFRGLSSDDKPITFKDSKVDNGSVFIEINTGHIYMYDLDSKEWNKI